MMRTPHYISESINPFFGRLYELCVGSTAVRLFAGSPFSILCADSSGLWLMLAPPSRENFEDPCCSHHLISSRSVLSSSASSQEKQPTGLRWDVPRKLSGFWSRSFIKKYGFLRACQVASLCFALGLRVNISIQYNNNSTAGWYVGLALIGMGWNFGFSSAAIWSTQSYQHAMHLKAKVQASNEGGMFLLSEGSILMAYGRRPDGLKTQTKMVGTQPALSAMQCPDMLREAV
jgi:hypothetical protein